MKESNCGRIPPCYGGKKFRIHEELEKIEAGDETHDMVYELNKQMCDIGKTMSDPMTSLSEDTGRAMLGCCELLAKDASDAKWMMDDIVRRAEENIRLYNDNNKYARLVRAAYESKFGKSKEKDIMKEKKTKKMTRAEAFEWLKGKKVNTKGKGEEVQTKLFECGFSWVNGQCRYYDFSDYLLFETDGKLYHCGNCGEAYWRMHHFEEISVDDILSIEIVEEKYELEFNYDKVVELAKPLMHYLNEVGCSDGIRVSQLGIVHEPMSTLIFNNGIGRIE